MAHDQDHISRIKHIGLPPESEALRDEIFTPQGWALAETHIVTLLLAASVETSHAASLHCFEHTL